uniref:Reverse transcriptase n=2 Tax=Panagrellus redivivus TaxID=6233 RepID=A0A7E4V2J1_PANRE
MGKGLKLPLNCRRCHSAPETLAHVMGTCSKNNGLINQRHNQVLDLVKKTAGRQKDPKANLQIEPTIKTASGNFRPDLLYVTEKEIHVIDVTCPIEGGQNMQDSRTGKLQKYEPLRQHLEETHGKKATVQTIVIGMLGAWDPENFTTLTSLDIPRHRQVTLARRSIEASIDGTRRIYATHVRKA